MTDCAYMMMMMMMMMMAGDCAYMMMMMMMMMAGFSFNGQISDDEMTLIMGMRLKKRKDDS